MTSATDEAGRLLAGRYRLLERIDRGGTAEVWRARDLRLERDVAVKILGKEADRAFRERFTTEARRAAAVIHPHVVTVFDEGQDGNDAFIVMEEVHGRSLRASSPSAARCRRRRSRRSSASSPERSTRPTGPGSCIWT